MRELDKPRSGSGGLVKTTSSWAYFQQLLFLQNVVVPLYESRDDNLTSTHPSQIITNELQTQHTFEDDQTETIQNSLLSEMNKENESDADMLSATAPGPPDITNIQPGSSKQLPHGKSNFRMIRANSNKRKLNAGSEGRSYNAATKEIETRKVDLLEREINAEEDPNLLFFKSLLPFMKAFTPTQTLRLRTKIQEIILIEHEAMQQGPVELVGPTLPNL
ncbi:unnamed protein product [Ceutorhynchus assimilis]|uniref:BESS domain-containing protein n=1 Tax=Ceutorhynchus assimilis TaxID=467358 RepID=A0A9N9QG96_9CUCU|nr:unnamed protein product [Ceutorhynchus assimilis]